jgi:hypothetical protein
MAVARRLRSFQNNRLLRRNFWFIVVAGSLVAGLTLWQWSAQGHLQVFPDNDAEAIQLSLTEKRESILPPGTQMTKERVAIIRGEMIGDECVTFRLVYADIDCRLASGSELSVGRGLRMGLSRKSAIEMGLLINRSYTEDGIYIDFTLIPSGGRMVGTGRPFKLEKVDITHQWVRRQTLSRHSETVIFFASASPVSLSNAATLKDLQNFTQCPYFAVVAEYDR